MSLLFSLAASAAYRYVVVANSGASAAATMEPWIGAAAASLFVAFGSVGVLVVPVCIASAVAAWRSCFKEPLLRLPLAWRMALRIASGLAASFGAFFIPIAIFLVATAAIAILAPGMAKFKNATEPEELAEFIPLEPLCGIVDSGGERMLECTLAARTAGKGYVLLDFGTPGLVLSSEVLDAGENQKFRLRQANAVSEKYNIKSQDLDTDTVASTAAWSLSFAATATNRGTVVALELGKPFVATLRIRVPAACDDGLLGYGLRSGGLYRLLYLRAHPLRESPIAPNPYAAVGPWQLPSEAFEKECPPEPPTK